MEMAAGNATLSREVSLDIDHRLADVVAGRAEHEVTRPGVHKKRIAGQPDKALPVLELSRPPAEPSRRSPVRAFRVEETQFGGLVFQDDDRAVAQSRRHGNDGKQRRRRPVRSTDRDHRLRLHRPALTVGRDASVFGDYIRVACDRVTPSKQPYTPSPF